MNAGIYNSVRIITNNKVKRELNKKNINNHRRTNIQKMQTKHKHKNKHTQLLH